MNNLLTNLIRGVILILPATLLTVGANPAQASLISVDWTLDSTTDGLATGTLDGFGVNLTSTDGSVNGGIAGNFIANWTTGLGTNDVPGIGTVINEGAGIDWNDGASGSATVSFSGSQVINPILLFNFSDGVVQTFDFADSISITLLDNFPLGSVSIGAGNVVTTNGSSSDNFNDGFAIQLIGTYTSISFNTNVNQSVSESVGFSVAVEDGNIQAVPEPLTMLGAGTALGFGTFFKRKLTAKRNKDS